MTCKLITIHHNQKWSEWIVNEKDQSGKLLRGEVAQFECDTPEIAQRVLAEFKAQGRHAVIGCGGDKATEVFVLKPQRRKGRY